MTDIALFANIFQSFFHKTDVYQKRHKRFTEKLEALKEANIVETEAAEIVETEFEEVA